jgi:triphosphoribosyl-dephospho-CoA synthase
MPWSSESFRRGVQLPSLVLTCQSLADQLQTACLLECAARKPGNVHPGAQFEDCSFTDFLRSAELVAPRLAQAEARGVGEAVLAAVKAVRKELGTNTNLGMILLLAPLAAVTPGRRCEQGIATVLNRLDMAQTRLIYEAIRIANPGGLGSVAAGDVTQEPTMTVLAAMRLAADRDSIARQYAYEFDDVLHAGRLILLNALSRLHDWEAAIISTQLQLMARTPDSLIQRKCGIEIARESQRRAQQLVAGGWPLMPDSAEQLAEFDAWLRADGHQRNPGTTADLVAAILFAAIRDGDWTPPARIDITL